MWRSHESEAFRYTMRVLRRRALRAAAVLALTVPAAGVLLAPQLPGPTAGFILATLRYCPTGRLVAAAPAGQAARACAEGRPDCPDRLRAAAAAAVLAWTASGGLACAGAAAVLLYVRRRRIRRALWGDTPEAPGPALRAADPAGALERLRSRYGVPLPEAWWSDAAAAVLEYLERHRHAPAARSRHDAHPGGLLDHTLGALLAAVPDIEAVPDPVLRRAATVMVLAHDTGKVVCQGRDHDRYSQLLAWRALLGSRDPDLRAKTAAVLAAIAHRAYGVEVPAEIRDDVLRLLPALRAEGAAVRVSRHLEVDALAPTRPDGAAPAAPAPGPDPLTRLAQVATPRGAAARPAAEPTPDPVLPVLRALAEANRTARREHRAQGCLLQVGRRTFLVPHPLHLKDLAVPDVPDWETALEGGGRLATASDLAEAADGIEVRVTALRSTAPAGRRLSLRIVGVGPGNITWRSFYHLTTVVRADDLPEDVRTAFIPVRALEVTVAEDGQDAPIQTFVEESFAALRRGAAAAKIEPSPTPSGGPA